MKTTKQMTYAELRNNYLRILNWLYKNHPEILREYQQTELKGLPIRVPINPNSIVPRFKRAMKRQSK